MRRKSLNVENPHSKGLWNSRSYLNFFLIIFPSARSNKAKIDLHVKDKSIIEIFLKRLSRFSQISGRNWKNKPYTENWRIANINRLEIIILVINYVIFIVPILINVAFVTLLERKILGLSQLRLGPNKVSLVGVLQPFSDAIKLLTKQSEANYNVNWKLFFLRPVIMLVTSFLLWNLLPLNMHVSKWAVIIISILVILRLGIYPLLISGWASNRKYATLGAIRGVAQTISYEISLALIMIIFILCFILYSARDHHYSSLVLLTIFPSVIIMWLVILLAETNRTPFDFSEGESELVSGFNIEYASTGFVLIFLSEYAIILLFSTASVIFFSHLKLFCLSRRLLSITLARVWIILRATLPRYRYDLLIRTAWKTYLPTSLGAVTIITLVTII